MDLLDQPSQSSCYDQIQISHLHHDWRTVTAFNVYRFIYRRSWLFPPTHECRSYIFVCFLHLHQAFIILCACELMCECVYAGPEFPVRIGDTETLPLHYNETFPVNRVQWPPRVLMKGLLSLLSLQSQSLFQLLAATMHPPLVLNLLLLVTTTVREYLLVLSWLDTSKGWIISGLSKYQLVELTQCFCSKSKQK